MRFTQVRIAAAFHCTDLILTPKDPALAEWSKKKWPQFDALMDTATAKMYNYESAGAASSSQQQGQQRIVDQAKVHKAAEPVFALLQKDAGFTPGGVAVKFAKRTKGGDPLKRGDLVAVLERLGCSAFPAP